MLYFCFSDLHGNYLAMENTIKESGYDSENPNHQLVSLGDEFGRSETSKGSKGIYEYLISDRFYNKPIIIRGNHQQILLDIFKKKEVEYSDIVNGELKTLCSFSGLSESDFYFFGEEEMIKRTLKTGVKKWIKDAPFFFETKNHYLFHGWCPDRNGKIDKHPEKASEKRWIYATWANTEEKIKKFIEIYPNGFEKTLVFGHWGSHHLRKKYPDGKNDGYYDIWEDKQHKLVGVDQTTFYNSNIKMYIFEDDPKDI